MSYYRIVRFITQVPRLLIILLVNNVTVFWGSSFRREIGNDIYKQQLSNTADICTFTSYEYFTSLFCLKTNSFARFNFEVQVVD